MNEAAKPWVKKYVNVIENGKSNSQDYYSKGLNDLFEICKRFALIEVLFTQEKPFVILDDPFTNLDDAKLEMAKKLVERLSDEYQIIYFVCSNSRDMLNEA